MKTAPFTAKLSGLALLAATGLLLTVLPAGAQTTFTALSAPNLGQTGSQIFAGTIGEEFTVGNQPIQITALGAFDSGSDGLTTPITVTIYDTGTQQSVGTLTLGSTTTVLNGGYRYDTPTAPFTLASGSTYRIAASGFNAANPNGNVNSGDPAPVTGSGAGLIASFGSSYYSLTANTYPTTLDMNMSAGTSGAPLYLGGSFQYSAVVPEPSTYVLMAGGLGLLLLGQRFRRTARTA